MRVVVGLVLAVVFVGVLVTALRNQARVKCEVCITFDGNSACRTSHGADRERATYGATQAACVVLAGGVTRGIQCSNTPPTSLACDE